MSKQRTEPQPGMLAQFSSECYRCGELIVRGRDRMVFRKGHAIHLACQSGQDDQ